ncbi:hypothetical protein HDK90DRAFT_498373 [Phyllosticta capitalensis]|uniref:Uncharacterized protein n=1 Tax=Phyllosticta capitalensis TaxID=121624 RepID=A0ABR1YD93_9PEZI
MTYRLHFVLLPAGFDLTFAFATLSRLGRRQSGLEFRKAQPEDDVEQQRALIEQEKSRNQHLRNSIVDATA